MTEDKLNNLFQKIRDQEPRIAVHEVEGWVAASAVGKVPGHQFSKFKSGLFTKNIVIIAISSLTVLSVLLVLFTIQTSTGDKKQLSTIKPDNQRKTEYSLINDLKDTVSEPVKKNKIISGNVKSNDTAKYIQPLEQKSEKTQNKTMENKDSSFLHLPKHKLKKIASIDLPGSVGKRFGDLTIDYVHNYLLVAHTDAHVLYVIDLKTNKLVKMIKDTPGVTDVEYVPELNKVYTSNTRDCTVGVIDMNTFEVIKKIPTTSKPNGSTYVPDLKKLYVSDELSKTLLVIDVVKDEVIKKITFNSKTGMPKYDSIAKKVYLTLPDKNKFVVIDPVKDSLITQYNIAYEFPHSNRIELDVKNRMAFVGCANGTITFFNLKTYQFITNVGMATMICEGSDVLRYDPGFKRIYVACSNGLISIMSCMEPKILDENIVNPYFGNFQFDDVPVYKKVHSLTVDITTHRVYAPEQEENGKAVSRVIVYDAVP